LLAIIALCASVKVTPDDRSIVVFRNGTPHGSITIIPFGVQTQKIFIDGDRL